MSYKLTNIHSAQGRAKAAVLIIYSGGTIGMIRDEHNALVAFDFNQVIRQLPALTPLKVAISVISFPVPLDSSNMKISNWIEIGRIILRYYEKFDGFIVLQGTDTMAFTASALSFMLEGLNKPVIFTGAQLPISAFRSDARSNLISAIEIAVMKKGRRALIPEVCIYFDYCLLRGNRTTKVRSSQFNAFESENYPHLAEVGVGIDVNFSAILKRRTKHPVSLNDRLDPNVVIIKIFPSLTREVLGCILNIKNLRGVILETYGSGNAPTDRWFIEILAAAIKRGVVIFNVSQCIGGKVIHGRYATSKMLEDIGVVSGGNITTEAAVTKMMYILGTETDIETIKKRLKKPVCGELDMS